MEGTTVMFWAFILAILLLTYSTFTTSDRVPPQGCAKDDYECLYSNGELDEGPEQRYGR